MGRCGPLQFHLEKYLAGSPLRTLLSVLKYVVLNKTINDVSILSYDPLLLYTCIKIENEFERNPVATSLDSSPYCKSNYFSDLISGWGYINMDLN